MHASAQWNQMHASAGDSSPAFFTECDNRFLSAVFPKPYRLRLRLVLSSQASLLAAWSPGLTPRCARVRRPLGFEARILAVASGQALAAHHPPGYTISPNCAAGPPLPHHRLTDHHAVSIVHDPNWQKPRLPLDAHLQWGPDQELHHSHCDDHRRPWSM
jgi:hypothetical protein